MLIKPKRIPGKKRPESRTVCNNVVLGKIDIFPVL